MERLIAITQSSDNSFYSALVIDEGGYTNGYDLFKIDGDTCKHNSGDGYCGLNKKTNIIEIPNNYLGGSTVWIADEYKYSIDEETCKDCIAPKVIKGIPTISQEDWDSMTEADSFANEVEYSIEDEDGNTIEDEEIIERFIKCFENSEVEFEDFDVNGSNICARFLRNNDGYTYQDEKISDAISKFEKDENLEVTVGFDDD